LLVDVRKAPIERITLKGVKTSDAEYELDVIIYATGYDAIIGSLTRIDIHGEGGQTIKDKFAEGPRTYLGIQSAGFPNLFTINQAGSGNYTRGAESIVEWVSECISYMREHKFKRISATPQAEEAWVEYVAKGTAGTLRTKANSWFVGANIPGKARVVLTSSPDSAPVYRAKRGAVASNGYEGFLLQ
jgi:cyclohexanone monooxygenase